MPSPTRAPSRSSHRLGLGLMVGAGTCWSLGGLLVRAQSIADPWEVVFWRSFFMVVALLAFLALRHRAQAPGRIRAVGRQGVVSGLLLASTFFFFIAAITRNPVANTMVLMSVGPFVVAVVARVWIRERVPLRTWAAIVVAVVGIVVMSAHGWGSEFRPSVFLALGVPLASAFNFVLLRRAGQHLDMIPAVLLAGLFSSALALPLALPLEARAWDLAMLAIMGVVQLGAGCVLMTSATRYLPAGEIGLLALLETILGPVWVWWAFGERPGALALVGGVVVVGAVIVNQLASLRAETRRR